MDKENFLKVAEFGVAIAFGVAYAIYDLHIATLVLIIAMTLFVLMVKALGQKLTKIQLVSWIAIVLLGGAAVIFKDDSIIKWKPTVINTVIGLTFFITHVFGKKSLVETLIADKVPAPSKMLRNVNLAASGFFIFLASINILVAQNFSTTVWVNFKIFGIFVLNLSFLSGCFYYLKDYLGHLLDPKK